MQGIGIGKERVIGSSLYTEEQADNKKVQFKSVPARSSVLHRRSSSGPVHVVQCDDAHGKPRYDRSERPLSKLFRTENSLPTPLAELPCLTSETTTSYLKAWVNIKTLKHQLNEKIYGYNQCVADINQKLTPSSLSDPIALAQLEAKLEHLYFCLGAIKKHCHTMRASSLESKTIQEVEALHSQLAVVNKSLVILQGNVAKKQRVGELVCQTRRNEIELLKKEVQAGKQRIEQEIEEIEKTWIEIKKNKGDSSGFLRQLETARERLKRTSAQLSQVSDDDLAWLNHIKQSVAIGKLPDRKTFVTLMQEGFMPPSDLAQALALLECIYPLPEGVEEEVAEHHLNAVVNGMQKETALACAELQRREQRFVASWKRETLYLREIQKAHQFVIKEWETQRTASKDDALFLAQQKDVALARLQRFYCTTCDHVTERDLNASGIFKTLVGEVKETQEAVKHTGHLLEKIRPCK